MNNKKLLFGIGVNDADYVVNPTVNGKVQRCPYYIVWQSMIGRCYDKNIQKNKPTYQGCSVHPDWHYFTKFKKWMMEQDWIGKSLDKDLLFPGNKIYSQDTCVFISRSLNNFTTESEAARGEQPLGVYWNSRKGKYVALCSNPFTGKQDHVGYFDDPINAHKAWIQKKKMLAYKLADIQTDERVANALRNRYNDYLQVSGSSPEKLVASPSIN